MSPQLPAAPREPGTATAPRRRVSGSVERRPAGEQDGAPAAAEPGYLFRCVVFMYVGRHYQAALQAQFANYPPLLCPKSEAAGFRHDGSIESLVARALEPV